MEDSKLPSWLVLLLVAAILAGSSIGVAIDAESFALELAASLVGFSLLLVLGAPLVGWSQRRQIATAKSIAVDDLRAVQEHAQALIDLYQSDDWREQEATLELDDDTLIAVLEVDQRAHRTTKRLVGILSYLDTDRVKMIDPSGPWFKLEAKRVQLAGIDPMSTGQAYLEPLIDLVGDVTWYLEKFERSG